MNDVYLFCRDNNCIKINTDYKRECLQLCLCYSAIKANYENQTPHLNDEESHCPSCSGKV